MPILVEVTRQFTFDAAHRLPDYVGKCNFLHGHTYKLELSVKGPRDSRGIVADFGDLKAIFKEEFEPLLDHKYLNETLPMVNTTAENLVVWFFDRWHEVVQPKHPELTLTRVRIWETQSSCATLTAEDWGDVQAGH